MVTFNLYPWLLTLDLDIFDEVMVTCKYPLLNPFTPDLDIFYINKIYFLHFNLAEFKLFKKGIWAQEVRSFYHIAR